MGELEAVSLRALPCISHSRGFWIERVPTEVLGGMSACTPGRRTSPPALLEAVLHRLTEQGLDLHQVLAGLLSSYLVSCKLESMSSSK